MGALFGKSKKPASRVTTQDKAILQIKQQRDKLKQYQKRIELSLQIDRELAKKCLQQGRKDRAKSLLRKKKYQENLLSNADKQLENLEKLAADIEFAQFEVQVVEGLRQGNEALKVVNKLLDVTEIEQIVDETREGVEKQREIDAILSNVLTEEDEEDVLAELDALSEDKITELPAVPTHDLPSEDFESEDVELGTSEAPRKKSKSKTSTVLVQAT